MEDQATGIRIDIRNLDLALRIQKGKFFIKKLILSVGGFGISVRMINGPQIPLLFPGLRRKS